MDVLNAMIIRDACRYLLMQHLTAVDREPTDVEAFVGVFADEFIWKRPGTPHMRTPADGRAYIERVQAKRRGKNPHGFLQRHGLTTVCIDSIDEQTAKGVSYALIYTDPQYSGTQPAPMTPPESVVEYRDLFKKTLKG